MKERREKLNQIVENFAFLDAEERRLSRFSI